MPTEPITSLLADCEAGRRHAEEWSDHLAAVARAVGPGPTQRLAVAGSHRLARIADLWAERCPTIPLEPAIAHRSTPVGVPGSLDGLRAMLEGLLADAGGLLDAADPDLDPSTRDLARRLSSEAHDLLTLHDRLLP